MVKKPGMTVCVAYAISVLVISYVLRLFEREYYRQLDDDNSNLTFDSFFTSVWCVVITMTTVGYGDTYAVSDFGRYVSILNAIWGQFILALMMALIGRMFELDP